MAKLVLFGAGDIARLAHFYFSKDSDHEVCGFAVDRKYRQEDHFLGLPLVDFETVEQQFPPGQHLMFIAMSYARMNDLRAERYADAKKKGYRLASYVSSHATYLSESQCGDNCFILEDNTIQPFVRIGSNVTLWSGNHIGHDSVIDDHCFITSQVVVSGNCKIGHHCFLGVNATLRNSISIAPYTLIGAAAVIMKDTREREVYLPQRATLFDKTSDEVEL